MAAMKISKLRRQIAREAARLIYQQSDLRRCDATQLAICQLCPTDAHPRDVPDNSEICQQLDRLHRANQSSAGQQRFERYLELLHPLADVKQSLEKHPEGDALYHSLQVFELAKQALPYDEELLTAALLHDVGKAIERRDPLPAGLKALDGWTTLRTAWLMENLPVANQLAEGTLGVRARRRLESADDYDELVLLAECDRAGRCCGMEVADVEDAVAQLLELDRLHTHQEDQ